VARASEIAKESFLKYPPAGFDETQLKHMVDVHTEWKENALTQLPEYKNMASLNYITNGVLTFLKSREMKLLGIFGIK
jgi:hypothetical protein